MSELLNAFTTTAGKLFEKKRDTAGRTYYVKEGEGRVSRESWAGANKSLSRVVTDVDGQTPTEIAEAATAADLERVTGIPFDSQTGFVPIEDADSKAEHLRAEGNRFLSFWGRNDHLSRSEAAKEYIEFRNELAGVDNEQERAEIKGRYNIGGS